MAKVTDPQPVALLIGVIFAGGRLPDSFEPALAKRFGRIELRSPVFDFNISDYYEEEMGPGLKRAFFAFADLINPAAIVEIKLAANEMETEFARSAGRRLNIDPGYIDLYKLVLVSNKFMGQKIYLGKGVYADPTLCYYKGWKPYDWGFPDFKSGQYDEFLTTVRNAYKAKIRSAGARTASSNDEVAHGEDQD